MEISGFAHFIKALFPRWPKTDIFSTKIFRYLKKKTQTLISSRLSDYNNNNTRKASSAYTFNYIKRSNRTILSCNKKKHPSRSAQGQGRSNPHICNI